MKKLLITSGFLFLLLNVFSQSYKTDLEKINTFLKTFDNGYYGYLEIREGVIYDHYKAGFYSKMNINDISEAKVTEANRKIEIFCKNNASCVTDSKGTLFENMPFSTQSDFDAIGFAKNLNKLFSNYKQYSINADLPTSNETEVAPVDFPRGTKVKVIKEDKPYSLLGALSEEERPAEAVIGTVVSVFRPLGDGWYSGSIRLPDGTVKKYEKAMFEIVK